MTKFNKEHQVKILAGFFAFCFILLSVMSFMVFKNYRETQKTLEGSIDERMVSLAMAAKETIDIEKFNSYNSLDDIENDPAYVKELVNLKALAGSVGAKYIYALKKIDDKYYFIYDTDPAIDAFFKEYIQVPDMIKEAFEGKHSAAANIVDEYGSFSTGAIPLYYNEKLVGVVAADIDDHYFNENREKQFWNMAVLVGFIIGILVIMTLLLIFLLKQIKSMSDQLFKQAHYDKLTSLPNRQYLLEHLTKMEDMNVRYSVFFIDLDNFKSVNDTAGHDAGDDLLKNIGNYLSNASDKATAFRPASGALNVAARIGGDEFILVAPDLSEEEAEKFAEELIDGLNKKIPDKNIKKFGIGFSIGIAMSPEHSKNFHVLLKYADIAMYHAKKSGKNACLIYNDEMADKDEK